MPPDVPMPTDYRWAGQTEIWSPLPRAALSDPDPDGRPLWAVARLRPGVAVKEARAALEASQSALRAAHPEAYPGGRWSLDVVPVAEEVLGSAQRTLTMLSIAVLLVLVLTASNLALLLASRGESRRREYAVRTALGATARHLAAQGALESLAVALLGAAAGISFAAAAVAAVPALAPGAFPRSDRVSLDLGVFLFALLLSLAVALVVGARETWRRRRRDPWETLVDVRAASARGGPRGALLAIEVAISTVLVAGAALFLQSLSNLRAAPLGFSPGGVVTGDIVLPQERYATDAQVALFFEDVLARAISLPGVAAAGWTTTVPFWNPAGTVDVEIESVDVRDGPAPIVAFEAIGPGLLSAVGTAVLEGRDVAETDREGRPLVALVNRAFAQRFFPGASPLDRRIRLTGGGARPWLTIVGVVENARDQRISQDPRPRLSVPFRQMPEAAGRPTRYLSLMVRARGDAEALIRPLRAAVAETDPEVPLGAARALSSEVRSALARPTLAARLTGAFAAAALLLVLAGLYGLMASAVARRFREIGIRMALGAPRRSVVRLIVRDGLAPVLAGLAAGLAGAAVAARLARSLLFGVGAIDAVSLGAAVLAILATAAVSSALPAWRALRVDPAITLRRE
jgi:predicted permease